MVFFSCVIRIVHNFKYKTRNLSSCFRTLGFLIFACICYISPIVCLNTMFHMCIYIFLDLSSTNHFIFGLPVALPSLTPQSPINFFKQVHFKIRCIFNFHFSNTFSKPALFTCFTISTFRLDLLHSTFLIDQNSRPHKTTFRTKT